MYTWEKPFTALVSDARRFDHFIFTVFFKLNTFSISRKEIKQIRKTSYIRGVNLAFILFTTRTAIFISVLSYILFGNELSAQNVFVITCCFNLLKQTMTDFFPYAVAQVAEALVSVRRIQNFLLDDETKLLYEIKSNGYTSNDITEKSNDVKGVEIENITAKWNDEKADNTLMDISMNITPSTLVALIGPVGSGKTSLLHAILKELPLTKGRYLHSIMYYAVFSQISTILRQSMFHQAIIETNGCYS